MVSINSLLDNFKERITNPFFGTLIFVWLVRNWTLIYTIFNFEEKASLFNKRKYITDYFQHQNLYWEFFKNSGYALLLLLIGYFFIIVSRIILNAVYENIIPYFDSKVASKLVVNKSRFEVVRNDRKKYFDLTEQLEEDKVALSQENSSLKTKNMEFQNAINDLEIREEITNTNLNKVNAQVNNLHKDLSTANTKFDNEVKNYNNLSSINEGLRTQLDYYKNFDLTYNIVENDSIASNVSFTKSENNLIVNYFVPEEIINIGNVLKSGNILKEFYEIADNINNTKPFIHNEAELYQLNLNKFLNLKLFDYYSNGNGIYITKLGHQMLMYRLYMITG